MAQHCMERMGEKKLYFSLLKSEKRSVSTHFVADCGQWLPKTAVHEPLRNHADVGCALGIEN